MYWLSQSRWAKIFSQSDQVYLIVCLHNRASDLSRNITFCSLTHFVTKIESSITIQVIKVDNLLKNMKVLQKLDGFFQKNQ